MKKQMVFGINLSEDPNNLDNVVISTDGLRPLMDEGVVTCNIVFKGNMNEAYKTLYRNAEKEGAEVLQEFVFSVLKATLNVSGSDGKKFEAITRDIIQNNSLDYLN